MVAGGRRPVAGGVGGSVVAGGRWPVAKKDYSDKLGSIGQYCKTPSGHFYLV